MALIPFQYIYNGQKLIRVNTSTDHIGRIEAPTGTIKSISVQAPNVGATGSFVFNVRKNGTPLLSGGDRLTVNTSAKRVEKTDADFDEITTAEGDLLSFVLDEVAQGGILGEIIFNVVIDDGTETGGGAESLDELTDVVIASPANDDFLQRKSGSFVNRTVAQVKTDLSVNNVDNTSDATKNSASATLTNKTISGANNTISNIAQASVTNLTADLSNKMNSSGGTFSGDVSVPDEAYDASAWNGSMEVPTKNAVRDKIESLSGNAALSQATQTITTASINSGITENKDVAVGKHAIVRKVSTDRAARVRAYSSAAYRTADAARANGADDSNVVGLLLEAVTTAGNLDLDAKQAAILFNSDGTVGNMIYWAIENRSGVASTVSVTITKLVLE